MNKNERNYWLDFVLFIAFLTIIATGFSLRLVDPNFHYLTYAFSDRKILLAFHIGSGFIGFLGVVVHIKWHWPWLKALRGKSVLELKKPVRANRIINRKIWFAYISSMVFGLLVWSLHAILPAEAVTLLGRLHYFTSLACLFLLAMHLILHRKWIASAIQRYSPGINLVGWKGLDDFPK